MGGAYLNYIIMEYKIVHQPELRLFKTELEGRVAFVEYRLLDNCFDIVRTFVPKPIEGRGIASALVKMAYDYASQNGWKPIASCSYAVLWLKRHPELNSDQNVE